MRLGVGSKKQRSIRPLLCSRLLCGFVDLFTSAQQSFLHLLGQISIGCNLWRSSVALCGVLLL